MRHTIEGTAEVLYRQSVEDIVRFRETWDTCELYQLLFAFVEAHNRIAGAGAELQQMSARAEDIARRVWSSRKVKSTGYGRTASGTPIQEDFYHDIAVFDEAGASALHAALRRGADVAYGEGFCHAAEVLRTRYAVEQRLVAAVEHDSENAADEDHGNALRQAVYVLLCAAGRMLSASREEIRRSVRETLQTWIEHLVSRLLQTHRMRDAVFFVTVLALVRSPLWRARYLQVQHGTSMGASRCFCVLYALLQSASAASLECSGSGGPIEQSRSTGELSLIAGEYTGNDIPSIEDCFVLLLEQLPLAEAVGMLGSEPQGDRLGLCVVEWICHAIHANCPAFAQWERRIANVATAALTVVAEANGKRPLVAGSDDDRDLAEGSDFDSISLRLFRTLLASQSRGSWLFLSHFPWHSLSSSTLTGALDSILRELPRHVAVGNAEPPDGDAQVRSGADTALFANAARALAAFPESIYILGVLEALSENGDDDTQSKAVQFLVHIGIRDRSTRHMLFREVRAPISAAVRGNSTRISALLLMLADSIDDYPRAVLALLREVDLSSLALAEHDIALLEGLLARGALTMHARLARFVIDSLDFLQGGSGQGSRLVVIESFVRMIARVAPSLCASEPTGATVENERLLVGARRWVFFTLRRLADASRAWWLAQAAAGSLQESLALRAAAASARDSCSAPEGSSQPQDSPPVLVDAPLLVAHDAGEVAPHPSAVLRTGEGVGGRGTASGASATHGDVQARSGESGSTSEAPRARDGSVLVVDRVVTDAVASAAELLVGEPRYSVAAFAARAPALIEAVASEAGSAVTWSILAAVLPPLNVGRNESTCTPETHSAGAGASSREHGAESTAGDDVMSGVDSCKVSSEARPSQGYDSDNRVGDEEALSGGTVAARLAQAVGAVLTAACAVADYDGSIRTWSAIRSHAPNASSALSLAKEASASQRMCSFGQFLADEHRSSADASAPSSVTGPTASERALLALAAAVAPAMPFSTAAPGIIRAFSKTGCPATSTAAQALVSAVVSGYNTVSDEQGCAVRASLCAALEDVLFPAVERRGEINGAPRTAKAFFERIFRAANALDGTDPSLPGVPPPPGSFAALWARDRARVADLAVSMPPAAFEWILASAESEVEAVRRVFRDGGIEFESSESSSRKKTKRERRWRKDSTLHALGAVLDGMPTSEPLLPLLWQIVAFLLFADPCAPPTDPRATLRKSMTGDYGEGDDTGALAGRSVYPRVSAQIVHYGATIARGDPTLLKKLCESASAAHVAAFRQLQSAPPGSNTAQRSARARLSSRQQLLRGIEQWLRTVADSPKFAALAAAPERQGEAAQPRRLASAVLSGRLGRLARTRLWTDVLVREKVDPVGQSNGADGMSLQHPSGGAQDFSHVAGFAGSGEASASGATGDAPTLVVDGDQAARVAEDHCQSAARASCSGLRVESGSDEPQSDAGSASLGPSSGTSSLDGTRGRRLASLASHPVPFGSVVRLSCPSPPALPLNSEGIADTLTKLTESLHSVHGILVERYESHCALDTEYVSLLGRLFRNVNYDRVLTRDRGQFVPTSVPDPHATRIRIRYTERVLEQSVDADMQKARARGKSRLEDMMRLAERATQVPFGESGRTRNADALELGDEEDSLAALFVNGVLDTMFVDSLLASAKTRPAQSAEQTAEHEGVLQWFYRLFPILADAEAAPRSPLSTACQTWIVRVGEDVVVGRASELPRLLRTLCDVPASVPVARTLFAPDRVPKGEVDHLKLLQMLLPAEATLRSEDFSFLLNRIAPDAFLQQAPPKEERTAWVRAIVESLPQTMRAVHDSSGAASHAADALAYKIRGIVEVGCAEFPVMFLPSVEALLWATEERCAPVELWAAEGIIWHTLDVVSDWLLHQRGQRREGSLLGTLGAYGPVLARLTRLLADAASAVLSPVSVHPETSDPPSAAVLSPIVPLLAPFESRAGAVIVQPFGPDERPAAAGVVASALYAARVVARIDPSAWRSLWRMFHRIIFRLASPAVSQYLCENLMAESWGRMCPWDTALVRELGLHVGGGSSLQTGALALHILASQDLDDVLPVRGANAAHEEKGHAGARGDVAAWTCYLFVDALLVHRTSLSPLVSAAVRRLRTCSLASRLSIHEKGLVFKHIASRLVLAPRGEMLDLARLEEAEEIFADEYRIALALDILEAAALDGSRSSDSADVQGLVSTVGPALQQCAAQVVSTWPVSGAPAAPAPLGGLLPSLSSRSASVVTGAQNLLHRFVLRRILRTNAQLGALATSLSGLGVAGSDTSAQRAFAEAAGLFGPFLAVCNRGSVDIQSVLAAELVGVASDTPLACFAVVSCACQTVVPKAALAELCEMMMRCAFRAREKLSAALPCDGPYDPVWTCLSAVFSPPEVDFDEFAHVARAHGCTCVTLLSADHAGATKSGSSSSAAAMKCTADAITGFIPRERDEGSVLYLVYSFLLKHVVLHNGGEEERGTMLHVAKSVLLLARKLGGDSVMSDIFGKLSGATQLPRRVRLGLRILYTFVASAPVAINTLYELRILLEDQGAVESLRKLPAASKSYRPYSALIEAAVSAIDDAASCDTPDAAAALLRRVMTSCVDMFPDEGWTAIGI